MKAFRFLFLLLTFSTLVHGQTENVPLADQKEAQEFILETKKSWVEIENPDQFTEDELDSILWMDRQSIQLVNVVYAPDSAFKIFVLEGEGCGAYCNPFWHSKLVLKNGGKEYSTIQFTTIDTIHKISPDQYLIIQDSYGRPASVYTTVCKRASFIAFRQDSIIHKKIDYTLPWWRNSSASLENDLNFCQQDFFSSSPSLSYNEKTKMLSYSYSINLQHCCQIDSSVQYSANLSFQAGKFSQQEVEILPISLEDH